MELTIKHLAPYLPYGLPLYRQNKMGEWKIVHMNNGNIYYPIDNNYKCKPLLKPISDLIPIEYDEVNDYVLINIVNSTEQHCDAYDEWRDSYFDNPEPDRILQSPYEVFQNLLSEHFDVFGLIDAGLAINTNTLPAEQA